MTDFEIIVSDEEPSADSDLVLDIAYKDGNGSAARAFEIAAKLIHALEDMDRVFSQSIHLELETALIVEDLQKSSVKVFLKNVLKGLPDEALKDGDVKKLIGHYLLKAKYAAIRWLDEEEKEHRPISDLTEEVAQLAKETDLRHLPDYPAPNPARLAQPLDGFQEAKREFREGEGLTITLGKDQYTVDTSKNWLPSETLENDQEEKQLVNEQDVFLIISKPDFHGKSKWAFRHGKKTMSLNIDDEDWLNSFQKARQIAIKPGDALRVRLRIEHNYDKMGDLVSASQTIVKVFDVIEGTGDTPDMFDVG